MRSVLNKREIALLTKVYHSSGGVLRSLISTSEQNAAHKCVEKGYLNFKPSMIDLDHSYDQWVLVYGKDIEGVERKATENDIISRATLWNDSDEDDDEWLNERNDDGDEDEYDEDEY